MAGHAMMRVRPAAAEVKNMLLKIKMDNIKRGKALAAMSPDDSRHSSASGAYPSLFSFNGGGCCGGAHYIESPSNRNPFTSNPVNTISDDTRPATQISCYDETMPLHRNLRSFASMSTATALPQNSIAENYKTEKKPIKKAFEEMGSFTSMSKIVPATDTDKDIEHEFRQLKNVETLNKTRKDRDIEFSSLDNFLKHCTERLIGLPEPISRNWKKSTTGVNSLIDHTNSRACEVHQKEENVRVLQWNVLSQTLGTKNDNFVRCPKPALEWRTRRFRMLEEIARHDADVICLQEVDHFPLVKEALACLGYDGHFFPKPDSPCLYLPENSGPDGCAIFYKTNKFDLERVESRVIEVWCVQSNQVVLSTVLKSKTTQAKIVIATTHLKARNGALLSTLRNEQGKDLLAYLEKVSCHGKIPVICTGDFNAEPTEPVYQTITDGTDNISFQSAYAETTITDEAQPDTQKEAKYTTWKIREDGEHIQTLDYIFYHSPYNTTANTDLSSGNDEESNNMYTESIENNVRSKSHPVCNQIQVEKVLDFPTGDQISVDRIPSFSYASDHFSLLADFKLKSVISESEE